ncbi:hypothetical protein, partial [Methanobrevibacter sp.]
LLERGIKNDDFINYNKISIDSYIKCRRLGKTHKDIMEYLHLPDDIVEFWLNTHVKELDYFKTTLDDTLIDLILKAIKENKTKNEFLTQLDITQQELVRLLEKYPNFNQIYTREYTQKRRDQLHYFLNENNLKNSLEKSHLDKKEYDEWLKTGEKDFELGHDTELAKFYEKTITQLMSLYIGYRKSAIPKREAASKIDKTTKTIDSWLRRDDYEIFLNFQNQCQKITLDMMVNGLKRGMTLKQVSALADMSKSKLQKLIKRGEKGEEKYLRLYEAYKNCYVPKQLNVFIEKLKTSKYKNALKASHLTEEEINKFYIEGLKGISTYKKFSDEYFGYKLENYTREIIQKGKTPQRAARNVNFIEEDFRYRQSEIDNELIQKQLDVIMPMLNESYHLKYIASRVNMELDQLFDWYIMGYEGDETLKNFAESYWENRIEPAVADFQSLFDKGISEKFLLKNVIRKNVIPEYLFWKQLGLFSLNNKMLSEQDQFKIMVENTLEVKENVKNLLAMDDESDLEVPIEELVSDIDDADVKRLVQNHINRGDDEIE